MDPGAKLWAFRARAEAMTSARFAQIEVDLRAAGADPTVLALTGKAVQDEARHVALCSRLARELGSGDEAPSIETIAAPTIAGLAPGQVTLLQVVGTCCINETISVALLTRMLHNSRGGPAHACIHEILTDEVDHARIGWAHLQAQPGGPDVRVIAQALPALLDNATTDELFDTPEADDLDARLENLGGLRRQTRLDLLVESLREVVFVGLEHFGVDTGRGREWLAQRL